MARRKKRRRGEGSVWPIPGGSWRAEVPMGTGAKPVRAVFPTEAEAVKWKVKTCAERDAGGVVRAAVGTVGDRVGLWLAARAGEVGANTLYHNRLIAERYVLPSAGKVPLAKFTAEAAGRWADGLVRAGVTAFQRRRAVTLLKRVLAGCVGTLIPTNPLAAVKLPRVAAPEVRAYRADEAARLVGHAGKWAAFVRLMLDAGLRPQEAFALRWEDVDLSAGVVRVEWATQEVAGRVTVKRPKTRAGRRAVNITPRTVEALSALPGRSGLVFGNRLGKPYSKSNFRSRHWVPLVARAGVPYIGGAKVLRHTSATLLLAAGAPVKAVSQRLGHESIDITLKFYAACLPTDQAAVVKAAEAVFG